MARSLWVLALVAACSTKQPEPKPDPAAQAQAAHIAQLQEEIRSESHISSLLRNAAQSWHIVAELRHLNSEMAEAVRTAKTDADRAAAKTKLDETKAQLEQAQRDAETAENEAKAAEREYVKAKQSAGSNQ